VQAGRLHLRALGSQARTTIGMRAGAHEGCPHEDRYLVAEVDNGAASRQSKVKAARKGRSCLACRTP